MSPSEDREAQAARLFALAIAARERGDLKQAEELTQLALQYTDETIDTSTVEPAPSELAQPPLLQQQQVQPEEDEE
jgi:hypothetical protein